MYSTSLCFFWHLLQPNWSIFSDTVSLQTFGKIPQSTTFSFDNSDLPIFKHRYFKDYKLIRDVFQKYSVVHEISAVKNSVSTYVCYTPDGLFWCSNYFSKQCFWKFLIFVFCNFALRTKKNSNLKFMFIRVMKSYYHYLQNFKRLFEDFIEEIWCIASYPV